MLNVYAPDISYVYDTIGEPDSRGNFSTLRLYCERRDEVVSAVKEELKLKQAKLPSDSQLVMQ